MNNDDKKTIVEELETAILDIEKNALSQLSKPDDASIISGIISYFEGEFSKHEDKENTNK